MGKYLVDTNIWIEFFRCRKEVVERMVSLSEDIFVSEITIAELLYGALHSKNVQRHLLEPQILRDTFKILPISDVLMDYAKIRQHLVSHGAVVDDFDMLIGATALHYGLTLVTDNVKHFSQMPGIEIENWVMRPSDK